MKFKKTVLIEINERELDKAHWDKFDSLIEKKVFLASGATNLLEELKEADCILVGHGGVEVNKQMIDTAKNAKYIGVFATGYGRLDVGYAAKKKITTCNIPGYSTESVAEFAIAVILERIRSLAEGMKRGRAGDISEKGIIAWEIKGKIFSVFGLGSIGNRVAELAAGFGADVRYWSRSKKKVDFKYQDPDELIKESDFISLNFALNSETTNFLTSERINNIKAGAVVVNTAPMELIDFDALVERLANNDITFIFDHSDEITKEQLQTLIKFANCIIYPSMAYISNEAMLTRKDMFVGNIESFLKGFPTNVVYK